MSNNKSFVEDIPQLVFIKELEEELAVPAVFFHGLLEEDDWSFAIKLHALIEAAITHLLTEALGEPELRDIISRLELSNLTTGKLAFVKSMSLLDRDSRRFIQKLSELRNHLVHDVANVSINLKDYFSSLEEGELKGSYKAFQWGYANAAAVKVKVDDDLYDLHELIKLMAIVTLEYSHKMAIWLGSIIILRQIYAEVATKRYEKAKRELEEQLIEFLEEIVAGGDSGPEHHTEKTTA